MESDREPVREDWVYVPAPPDTRTYTELGTFIVDDETFTARRSEEDGAIHYAWVSGPNEGYGFSSSGGFSPLSHEYHAASIRDFLCAVDPVTGYFYDP